MSKRLCILLSAGLLPLCWVSAQVDLSNRPENISWGDPPGSETNSIETGLSGESATSGQFGGVAGITSGSDRAVTSLGDLPLELPTNGEAVLVQSFVGGTFSGSIPDYFIGDTIPTPEPVTVAGFNGDEPIVFRAEPLASDETFLVRQEGDGGSELSFSPDSDPFQIYWSLHAEKVFAADAGRVTIHWRSQDPIDLDGSNNPIYFLLSETVSISAGSAKTPVTIYWTEGRFTGPWINTATAGSTIQEVVVVYNSQIPGTVPEDEIYRPEGSSELPLPSRTLWWDSTQKLIKAYNREGRVLVEYLGQLRGEGAAREHLGLEVVDVVQEAPPEPVRVYLGDRVSPSDGADAVGEELASPDGQRLFDPADFSISRVNPPKGGDDPLELQIVEGKPAYYAVGENQFVNEVQAYWLKASPTGGLGLEWPAYLNSYDITWPDEIDGYFALNARPLDSSLVRPTAFQFPPALSPRLKYQDDPTENEAVLNSSSELEINFASDSDNANRALFLLRGESDFWYLRVYSYLEENVDDLRLLDRETLVTDLAAKEAAVVTAVTNLTNAVGDSAIAAALAALEAAEAARDAAAFLLFRFDQFEDYHVQGVVAVGERVPPPPLADSVAGYLSLGVAYNPAAYIDPIVEGVAAAEAGAIIPVNARPGISLGSSEDPSVTQDKLMVWWFREVTPPVGTEGNLPSLFFPSIVGEYTIVWPGDSGTDDVSEIVLASNEGSGDLSVAQQSATLYRQNDPTQLGYNPNDEHALSLGGRFYALRDDLVAYDSDSNLLSSLPYVLIDYTNPTDGRPAMRAFRVLREKDVDGDGDFADPDDITFTYPALAGTVLQAPLPLSVMPPPLRLDSNSEITSANTEVTSTTTDPAGNIPTGGLPTGDPSTGEEDWSHYNGFTYEDRKGAKWVYRGPHDVDDLIDLSGLTPTATFTTAGELSTFDGAYSDGDLVDATWSVTIDFNEKTSGDPEVIFETGSNAIGISLAYESKNTLALRATGTDDTNDVLLEAAVALTTEQLNDGELEIVFTHDQESSGPETIALWIDGALAARARGEKGSDFSDSGAANFLTGTSDLAGFEPEVGSGIAFSSGTANTTIGLAYYKDTLFDPLPVIGMQYYYATLETFDFPDVATGADAAPTVGTIVPYLRPYVDPNDPTSGYGTNAANSEAGTPLTVHFVPMWPDDPRLPFGGFESAEVPELRFSETLTLPKFGLPQIRGNISLKILYEQSVAEDVTTGKKSATLYDPTRQKVYELGASLPGSTSLTAIPGDVATTTSQGKIYFQNLPPHLQERFYFDPLIGGSGALVLVGEFVDSIVGEDYLLPNILSSDSDVTTNDDVAILKNLSADTDWALAIDALTTKLETFVESTTVPGTYEPGSTKDRSISGTGVADIVDSDTAADSFALTAVGGGSGYVVLIAQDDKAFSPESEPVAVQILKVGGGLYLGDVKPITPSNPLSEQVTLQHSGDFAGDAINYEFEWRYSPPDDGLPPNLPDHETDPGTWLALETAAGANRTVFGGGAQPLLTMSDNYVIMRYRPLDTTHPAYVGDGSDDSHWSGWTAPALAEGWIKRVLAGINPFNQRLTDFFNNAIDTDISLLTQAGTRWEGDVALTLDNIDDVGLLEIYETVLNRGIGISIKGTPAVDYAPANDALLLAAGYIADLYQIIGDEAFADAANPMILFDTQSIPLVANPSLSQGFSEFFRETATSRFAFEGQVPSLIEEELVLLRGRDDAFAPGVQLSPVYNRFFWNYTRGIDAGEVLYALNYNIRERQEEDADGVVDATDAARQYPQGHGDAYGHYLTILKGYYRLLREEKFSWAPRIEAVNILGVPVSVDYLDERKFSAAAASLGRASEQILELVHRQVFTEDKAGGWDHLRDGKVNTRTGRTRHWGLDEWAARSAQGGFFHWVTANALLPEEDTVNEGIQKIDRTTVPELDELALQAAIYQNKADEASLFVNPLGLTSESLLFDISPEQLANGKTHFEQVYERAVTALANASSVFDRARESTRLLRALENQSDEFSTAVFDEERAFTQKLKEIYGTPYAGDIGPGKFYEQGYDGPDLFRYMYIDEPFHFEDPKAADATITLTVPGQGNSGFTRTYNDANAFDLALKGTGFDPGTFDDHEEGDDSGEEDWNYTLETNDLAQIATADMGRRAVTGRLQQALLRVATTKANAAAILTDHQRLRVEFDRGLDLFKATVQMNADVQSEFDDARDDVFALEQAISAMEALAFDADAIADIIEFAAGEGNEAFPKVVGLSNDPSFALRAVSFLSHFVGYGGAKISSGVFQTIAEGIKPEVEKRQFDFEKRLENLGFGPERLRMVWELEQAWDEYYLHQTDVDLALAELGKARQEYQSLLSEGNRILTEREIFRKRAAAIAQGFRTRDVAFRTFRTESLEQYQSLLDWASKYAYLAAKAYDYETGLLGSDAGEAFLNDIVQSRAVGLVDANGRPQLAGSDTGDPGLSGLLKELDGDWNVVRGRLGFNNPDTNGTTFSLRREHFRLPGDAAGDVAWTQALQAHVVDDLRTDPDIAAHALQIEGSEVPVPGLVLTFNSMIADGVNFFGENLQAGDHAFTPTAFATKIHSVGVVFEGYHGMDPCLVCEVGGPGPVTSDHVDALSATPYVYLLPAGNDVMRTPPLGDRSTQRVWKVHDHALPLPYNLGDTAFSDVAYWSGAQSLSEPFFQPRKHQAFRAVDNVEFLYSDHTEDFTNRRLVGRSVWNTQWKLVIPGSGLLSDPVEGLDRFIRSVGDVQLYLKTYSYAGN